MSLHDSARALQVASVWCHAPALTDTAVQSICGPAGCPAKTLTLKTFHHVCVTPVAGLYSKFLAIGLFRLLELVGAKDPKALESVAKSLSLRPEAVNRDLLTYKAC